MRAASRRPLARVRVPQQVVAAIVFGLLVSATHANAQAAHSAAHNADAGSPLWGELTPGPYGVGFTSVKLRDATRTWFQPARGGATTAGYPLTLRYWYPATVARTATPMTFRTYLAADIVNDELQDATPDRIERSSADVKAFYERPPNFFFGAVEPDRWARLQDVRLRAVSGAPAVREKFPVVVGVGGALGNSSLGEYLASQGYVVVLISSPAQTDMSPVARMEWYVRDIEFALAHMRTLPNVDTDRVATWGFSFAGMPALLTAMRNPDVDAVVSLESAIFYPSFMGQLRGNAFYDPARLRVPFLHLMRASESRANEQLPAIDSLRYASRYRYLVNDTTIVHQDFGTHGIAAAVVLDKRPRARHAVVKLQAANADYVLHFLDAFVKRKAEAETWLARTPEENRVPRDLVTVVRASAVTPAPTGREFIAMIQRDGMAQAMTRFNAARTSDPSAPLFAEGTINALAYELLRGGRSPDALSLFKTNIELYPRSANAHDSLAEAYEAAGNSAQAQATARKALELIPNDNTLNAAAKDNLKSINEQRVRRLGGAP